jgi:putative FmdB family regulatory protein
MPTYEYVCTSCGHRLEAVQSFSDPALITCPVCQGALRKVFGNVGIVLKGSGFYKNDSRSTGRPIGSYGPPLENKEKGSTASSDSGSKDSGSKDSGSKDSGSKDSGSKDSGSKDSGSKDSHAAPAAASSGSSEKAAASKV